MDYLEWGMPAHKEGKHMTMSMNYKEINKKILNKNAQIHSSKRSILNFFSKGASLYIHKIRS